MSSVGEVVELIGNPRPGSRTRALADLVGTALARRLVTPLRQPRVLELADIVGVSFDSLPAVGGYPDGDPFAAVRNARLLIVATPAYKGSFTGLLKLFLDQFEAGALTGIVAVPVGVAASTAHLHAVGTALRGLLTELGATVPDEALTVPESSLPEADRLVSDWVDRYAATIDEQLSRPVVAGGGAR